MKATSYFVNARGSRGCSSPRQYTLCSLEPCYHRREDNSLQGKYPEAMSSGPGNFHLFYLLGHSSTHLWGGWGGVKGEDSPRKGSCHPERQHSEITEDLSLLGDTYKKGFQKLRFSRHKLIT